MKKELEQAYDIPFEVRENDDGFIVWPSNEMEEFFTVRISFRSEVRVIIEINPQDHAADMLRDMAKASDEKKRLFLGYLDTFIGRGFRTSVKINGSRADLHQEWPEAWHNLYIRLTRIETDEASFEQTAVAETVFATGMMLSLLNIVSTDEDGAESYEDGAKRMTILDRYERNQLNRQLCLQANGYTCKICGVNFEKKYGKIGRNFIHVHHIHQLSLARGPVKIDPVHDLIPVCPNCHAMLHTSTPPLTPDELKKILLQTAKADASKKSGNIQE